MKIIEINKKVQKTASKHEVEEKIKKLKKEYYKPVKGRFEFVDAQGGWVDFTDRQWPGEPIMQYHIEHAEICEIPAGLARRLNQTKKVVRGYDYESLDHKKASPARIVDRVSRINFIPVEFIQQDVPEEELMRVVGG